MTWSSIAEVFSEILAAIWVAVKFRICRNRDSGFHRNVGNYLYPAAGIVLVCKRAVKREIEGGKERQ